MTSEIVEMTYTFAAEAASGPRRRVGRQVAYARTSIEIDRFDGGRPVFEIQEDRIWKTVRHVVDEDGTLFAPLHDRAGDPMTLDDLALLGTGEDAPGAESDFSRFKISLPLLCYAHRRDRFPAPVPGHDLMRVASSRQDVELSKLHQAASTWRVGPDDVIYAAVAEPVIKLWTPHKVWITAPTRANSRTAAIFGTPYVDDPLTFSCALTRDEAFREIAQAHSAATGYTLSMDRLDEVTILDEDWVPSFDDAAHLHFSISKWLGAELINRKRADAIPAAVSYNMAVCADARERSGLMVTPMPDEPYLPVDFDEVAMVAAESVFHIGSQTYENGFMKLLIEHDLFRRWADLIEDGHRLKSEDNPVSRALPGI